MSNRTLSLTFLGLGHAYDHFFLLIFPTAVLALVGVFGASYAELLALATPGFIAFGLGTLPSGWLGDRWSARGMMIVFFIGIGASSVLTGLAQNALHIAIGLTLIGLFGSIYHPVGTAMVVRGAEKVGKVLAINGVAGNLGVASGALVTGVLTDWISWRTAFIAPGLISIVTGIAYMLLTEREVAPAKGGAKKPPAVPLTRQDQVKVFGVIIVASLFAGLVFNILTIALPKILEERLPGSIDGLASIGGLAALIFAVAAVAQLIAGYFLDRNPVKYVLLAVTTVQVPLMLLAATAYGWPALLLAFPIMFAVFGQIPINDWMVARFVGEAWRSRVYAVKYVLSLSVGSLAVPLIAWLHGFGGGFTSIFVAMAGFVSITWIAALFLPRAAASVQRATPAPATAAAEMPAE